MTQITVLSIKQPWCDLILSGTKDVENRTWTTNYRGTLYLQASQRFDIDGYEFLRDAVHEAVLRPRKDYVLGALLGRVVLRDVVAFDLNRTDLSPWHEEDMIGWYVEQAERFAKPIPLKGRLGLFHASIDAREIRVLEA